MLAYKQKSRDNKIQTISRHFSPKSSNKSTKHFFRLIQAKSKKIPTVHRPGGRRRRANHGSLEGVGGLKTSEAYHSKADALVIS